MGIPRKNELRYANLSLFSVLVIRNIDKVSLHWPNLPGLAFKIGIPITRAQKVIATPNTLAQVVFNTCIFIRKV